MSKMRTGLTNEDLLYYHALIHSAVIYNEGRDVLDSLIKVCSIVDELRSFSFDVLMRKEG